LNAFAATWAPATVTALSYEAGVLNGNGFTL